MRILGIDPGLRHTGWAVLTRGVLGSHGLILTPGHGKLLPSQAISYILSKLDLVLDRQCCDLAAIEEVVWRGMRRRITMPLSHVAGAIAGFTVARGVDTYLLTPAMKDRGEIKFRGEWSNHEQDAARLALRVWHVLSAPENSGRSKQSVDNELKTFVARLVPGLPCSGG